MKAGQAGRTNYEYEREGAYRWFVAVEPEAGACHQQASERYILADVARLMREL